MLFTCSTLVNTENMANTPSCPRRTLATVQKERSRFLSRQNSGSLAPCQSSSRRAQARQATALRIVFFNTLFYATHQTFLSQPSTRSARRQSSYQTFSTDFRSMFRIARYMLEFYQLMLWAWSMCPRQKDWHFGSGDRMLGLPMRNYKR